MRLEPLLTVDETRRAEEAHPGYPDSMGELMERAGTAVADVVQRRFPGRVAVVCGKGSNGGDGRVCARVLRERGREVDVVEQVGEVADADVIVDALFGIGLNDAPRDDAARMIGRINDAGKPVIAVDVPSGVDSSTGEVPGVAVRAAVTVTFGAAKVGLAVSPGRLHAGSVHVAPIGLAVQGHEHALVPASVLAEVPRKRHDSTKYRAGSVLVVGGSRGLTGAPMLAALAAFRADAGYVAVAAPESTLPVLETRLLEAVKRPLPEDSGGRLLPRAADAVLDAASRADAVAIGPGLGRTEGTRDLVRILLDRLDLPVVLDADALWELEPFEARSAPTVLTPHAGELARLLATDAREVDAHRLDAVRRAASLFGCVVLLKGADTLVTAPRDRCPRLVLRAPVARDRRNGRRPDRRRRGVPREGNGAAPRRGRGRRRARRCVAPRSDAGGRDRLRPPAGAPAGARRRRIAVAAARVSVARSEVAIDLDALRRNVRRLLRELDGAELWAVVKADGYGHGGVDCARAAVEAGASALCVATVAEAVEVRRELPSARIVVLGPQSPDEVAAAREARLELVVSDEIPDDVPVHVKLDTGMGRWGVSELPRLGRDVVGVMTHLATADSDLAFAREQVRRFREATAGLDGVTRHVANSAAVLRLPEARFDAARCGIALYGLSPFGTDAGADGLEPVLSWRSELGASKLLRAGESTGYGRLFVAERETWIGIVPVGYADGFRRDLTGTHVLVEGEPRRVVGTVSMDAFAVELESELPPGTPVTIVGPGVPLEAHARVAGTITYELASRISSDPRRARREVVGR